jgi:hypothetical protein
VYSLPKGQHRVNSKLKTIHKTGTASSGFNPKSDAPIPFNLFIGLSTDFRELKQYFKGGKPLILYVFGQTCNLALTLLTATIMLYLVFPGITAKV